MTQGEQELRGEPHFLDGVQLSKQNLHELPLGHPVPEKRNQHKPSKRRFKFKNLSKVQQIWSSLVSKVWGLQQTPKGNQ